MKWRDNRTAIDGLIAAHVLQGECAQERMVLEWAQVAFGELVEVWDDLQADECLAYEDKVRGQIRLMQEATSLLWRFHRALVQTRRILQQHQQEL